MPAILINSFFENSYSNAGFQTASIVRSIFSKSLFILFFFVFAFTLFLPAQNRGISEEIRFVSYLIDNSEYRDAVFIIDRVSNSLEFISRSQTDSLNFYAGWAFYSLKNLDSSAVFFDKVSNESEFYLKSKFYLAFDYIYLEKYDSAKAILNNISFMADSEYYKLKNFELAGIALLQRDYFEFSELAGRFDSEFYPVSAEQENFLKYLASLQAITFKPAFLAGLFSAIIPGSGKFYAGYRGQAIAAFLPVAMLAAVGLESFFKAGILSPQFIVFGGIFSVFYFGNIWGSALSVKTINDEKFYEIDQNILLDLHLPLRRIFN